MDSPITYYTPAIAPSGIGFYSADRYPGWRNSLFVAGLAGQQLRRIEVSGRKIVDQEVVFDALGRTRTVTTGPDGLLYILLQDRTGAGTGIGLSESTPGKLIRLVPVPTHAVSRN
jgi:glucose/arabinose dehydrogenase